MTPATNLPTAVITVLFGVGAYYLQHVPRVFGGAELAFIIAVVFFAIALILATIFLFSALIGRVDLVTRADKLDGYFAELQEYYSGQCTGISEIQKHTEQAFRKALTELYIQCATRIRYTNVTQAGRIVRCKQMIGVALLALFASVIPFDIMQSKRLEESAAGKPKPATGQGPTGQPATGQPAIGQPAIGQGPTGQPAIGQPAKDQPANQQPVNQQSAKDQPANQQPVNQQPANQQPANQQPANREAKIWLDYRTLLKVLRRSPHHRHRRRRTHIGRGITRPHHRHRRRRRQADRR